MRCHYRFNPRTREGANSIDGTYLMVGASFNPRTREGANKKQLPIKQVAVFQSTHP